MSVLTAHRLLSSVSSLYIFIVWLGVCVLD